MSGSASFQKQSKDGVYLERGQNRGMLCAYAVSSHTKSLVPVAHADVGSTNTRGSTCNCCTSPAWTGPELAVPNVRRRRPASKSESRRQCLTGRETQTLIVRHNSLLCLLCGSAFFGMCDQGGEARIAVKRIEIWLLFHSQINPWRQSMIDCLAQK
jgi:hypothetical protein